MTKVKINLELREDEAWTLAQLCKRFTWEDASNLSVKHDGGAERDEMLRSVELLRRALADAGYEPR